MSRRRSVSLEPEELAAASPRRSTRLARAPRCESPMIPSKQELIGERKDTPVKRTRRSMSHQEEYQSDLTDNEVKLAPSRRSTRLQGKDTDENKIPNEDQLGKSLEIERKKRATRSVSKSPTSTKTSAPLTPTPKKTTKRRLSAVDKNLEESKQTLLEVINENEEINIKTEEDNVTEKNNNKKIVEHNKESVKKNKSDPTSDDKSNDVMKTAQLDKTLSVLTPENKISSSPKHPITEKITTDDIITHSNDIKTTAELANCSSEGNSDSQKISEVEWMKTDESSEKLVLHVSEDEMENKNENSKSPAKSEDGTKKEKRENRTLTNENSKPTEKVSSFSETANTSEEDIHLILEPEEKTCEQEPVSIDSVQKSEEHINTVKDTDRNSKKSTKISENSEHVEQVSDKTINISPQMESEEILDDKKIKQKESQEVKQCTENTGDLENLNTIDDEEEIDVVQIEDDEKVELTSSTEDKILTEDSQDINDKKIKISPKKVLNKEDDKQECIELESSSIKEDVSEKNSTDDASNQSTVELVIDETQQLSDSDDENSDKTEEKEQNKSQIIYVQEKIVVNESEIIKSPNKNATEGKSIKSSESSPIKQSANASANNDSTNIVHQIDNLLVCIESKDVKTESEVGSKLTPKNTPNKKINLSNKNKNDILNEEITSPKKEPIKNVRSSIDASEARDSKVEEAGETELSEQPSNSFEQTIETTKIENSSEISENVPENAKSSEKLLDTSENSKIEAAAKSSPCKALKIDSEKTTSPKKSPVSHINIGNTSETEITTEVSEKDSKEQDSDVETIESKMEKIHSSKKISKSPKKEVKISEEESISSIKKLSVGDTANISVVSEKTKLSDSQNEDGDDNCESNISIVGSGSPDPKDKFSSTIKELTIDINEDEQEHNLSMVNDDGKSYSPIGKAADISQIISDQKENEEKMLSPKIDKGKSLKAQETVNLDSPKSDGTATDEKKSESPEKKVSGKLRTPRRDSLEKQILKKISSAKKNESVYSDEDILVKSKTPQKEQLEEITVNRKSSEKEAKMGKQRESEETTDSEMDLNLSRKKRKRLSKKEEIQESDSDVDKKPFAKKKRLSNKAQSVLFSDESDNEDNENSDDGNSSGEEEAEEEEEEDINEFIDDQAMEVSGEDTPSEDSNAIIDEGESIGSTSSQYDSYEDEESLDSFIVKDDDVEDELLSGSEISVEEPNDSWSGKKRKRILTISSDEDDEVGKEKNEEVDKLSMQPFGGFSPSHLSVNQVSSVDSDNESLQKRNEALSKMIEDNVEIKDDTKPRICESDNEIIEIIIDHEKEEDRKSPKKKEKLLRKSLEFKQMEDKNISKDSKRQSVDVIKTLTETDEGSDKMKTPIKESKRKSVEPKSEDIMKNLTEADVAINDLKKSKRKSTELIKDENLVESDDLKKGEKTPIKARRKSVEIKKTDSTEHRDRVKNTDGECKADSSKTANLAKILNVESETKAILKDFHDITYDQVESIDSENILSTKSEKKKKIKKRYSSEMKENIETEEIMDEQVENTESQSLLSIKTEKDKKANKRKSNEMEISLNETAPDGKENLSDSQNSHKKLKNRKSSQSKLQDIDINEQENIQVQETIKKTILIEDTTEDINETETIAGNLAKDVSDIPKKKKFKKKKSKENIDATVYSDMASEEELLLFSPNKKQTEEDLELNLSKSQKKKLKKRLAKQVNEDDHEIGTLKQIDNQSSLDDSAQKKKKSKKHKSKSSASEDVTPEKIFEDEDDLKENTVTIRDSETASDEDKTKKQTKTKKKKTKMEYNVQDTGCYLESSGVTQKETKLKSKNEEMGKYVRSPLLIKEDKKKNSEESTFELEQKYIKHPLKKHRLSESSEFEENNEYVKSPKEKLKDKEKKIKKKKSKSQSESEDIPRISVSNTEVITTEKLSKKKRDKEITSEYSDTVFDDVPYGQENESSKHRKKKVKKLSKKSSEDEAEEYISSKKSKSKEKLQKTDTFLQKDAKSQLSYLPDNVLNFVVEKEKNVKPSKSEIKTAEIEIPKPLLKRGYIKPSDAGSSNCGRTRVEDFTYKNLSNISRKIKKKEKKQKYSNLNVKLISASLSGQTKCSNFKEEFLYGQNVKRIDSSQLFKLKRREY